MATVVFAVLVVDPVIIVADCYHATGADQIGGMMMAVAVVPGIEGAVAAAVTEVAAVAVVVPTVPCLVEGRHSNIH